MPAIKNKRQDEEETPAFATKLCLLPSPIHGFILYGVMAVFSIIWIVASHIPCWRRVKPVVYIELDNLSNIEEALGIQTRVGFWRRGDIQGIARDCVSLFMFIGLCFTMQIVGMY